MRGWRHRRNFSRTGLAQTTPGRTPRLPRYPRRERRRDRARSSWEEPTGILGGADLLDTDRHRGGAVRKVIGPCARQHLFEGTVENMIFAPHHLLLFPEQLLQILHPFEIADHDATGVAENIRDQEDLVAALVQHQIG